jgi:hypothetical protein
MTDNAIDFSALSNDPEELARAFEQLEAGTPPAEPAPKEETAEQIATEQNNGKQDQSQEQNQPDPEGVATKDGKHVIPYSVLQSERNARSRAEQLAREAQERVTALEAQVNSANQGANNGESARTNQGQTASDISDEDLEVLKEDFPTVYKAVMASMAAARALEAKLAPVEESVRSQEAERAQSATESVQEAIDSVPKLAHIQASNPEAFALAQQFDNTLRGQAAWADRPLSERFAKVAEMVEATLGQIDLPGGQKTSQPSAEDLRKAAEAKAKDNAKATRSNVPTSLSEFPAGQHAAQDEKEAAENLSALQLAEKFASMSPDQMDAYFQTL